MTEAPAIEQETPQLLPFNPFDPAFHRDPYVVFKRLREQHGQVFRTSAGVLNILGHQEVCDTMTDPRFGRGDGETIREQHLKLGEEPPAALLAFMDPPDHTRLRALVSKAFTPRTVERLRPKAQAILDQLLVQARGNSDDGTLDLMSAVLKPLGGQVVNELLGIPEEYHEHAFAYSMDSARGLDPNFTLTPDMVRKRDEGRVWFAELARDLAAERRAHPTDDLLSDLVRAEQDGQRLTEMELITTAVNLLAAGFGATAAQMANSMLALLRHPEQLAWLRSHPERIDGAVEELLRFDGPLFLLSRTALTDAEVGGQPVAEGEDVFLVIGAASHDPAAYPDPDALDLSRQPNKVLGFGHGIHFCVAAPIARMTTQVALSTLAGCDITLTDQEPEFNGALVIRTLAHLPVRIG
jgi:unspecific monooxygenase